MKKSILRRVSSKLQKSLIHYRKIRDRYIDNHLLCECCWERSSHEIHHKRGRGIYLNEVKYFMAVCIHCHAEIEGNRKWAMEMGYRINRLGNL